jgi:hypothetical protein
MMVERPDHIERYAATYRDATGTEAIEIENDHETLRTSIRGLDFAGSDFDALAPVADEMAAQAAGFVLAHGSICACELRWEMPIAVATGDEHEIGRLEVHLLLGMPTATGGIDREDLQLRLVSSRAAVDSAGTSGWFEDELLDIQRKLPEGIYLRACIACGLSDYSPYGHGLFGGLACFREAKTAYRSVSTKQGLFAIWNSATGFVQETYRCPEFERRRPGTGYRG